MNNNSPIPTVLYDDIFIIFDRYESFFSTIVMSSFKAEENKCSFNRTIKFIFDWKYVPFSLER